MSITNNHSAYNRFFSHSGFRPINNSNSVSLYILESKINKLLNKKRTPESILKSRIEFEKIGKFDIDFKQIELKIERIHNPIQLEQMRDKIEELEYEEFLIYLYNFRLTPQIID